MSEQATETKQKSGKGKISLIIIIAITLIGGVVTAVMLAKSSDKQAYFTAEQKSIEYMTNEVEERFADELAWREVTETSPVESTVVLSAEYNDPAPFGGAADVEEIVNNSTITMQSQSDLENEALFADVSADIAGLTFDDIRLSLTDTEMLAELPFLTEVLQLESEDTGKLLHELDPLTFDEDDNFNFSDIFNQKDFPIPEEDRKYLVDHYIAFIYNNLPDSAFSSDKEEVTVDGETFKAEKVSLDLTEEEVKEFMTSIIEEMESDERLEEIIVGYLESSFLPAGELEMALEEYDESFVEMKEAVDEGEMPEGISSDIWVKNDLIVKRDLHFAFVDANDETGEIAIKGTQMLEDKEQLFDYDINVKDDFMDETINLTADLSWDGDKIDDTITLDLNEFVIEYQGDETYEDSKRDFDRSLSLSSPFMSGGIVWSGDAAYEKDQMSSNHNLFVEADGIGQDLLSVNLDVEGKTVKEVEAISADNVKDIGKMSEMELENYIEGEAAEQFFEWYVDKFGDLGM